MLEFFETVCQNKEGTRGIAGGCPVTEEFVTFLAFNMVL
jgi:hypothetical protein